jgi:quinoprotein glucose dehydrogenase
VAWTFRPGALPHDEELDHKTAFEATPILVDGKLYPSTPYHHVIALNPLSGEKLWKYDPKLDLPYGASEVTSRGVAAWRNASAKTSGPSALRIFVGTEQADYVLALALPWKRNLCKIYY